MPRSIETPRKPLQQDVLASSIRAWLALKAHLELRCKDLNDEVRSYPTPIARCDEQLTGLIERRSRAVELLRLFKDSDPMQSARPGFDRRAALEAYLVESGKSVGDEAERAVRLRLEEALGPAGPPDMR